MLFLFSIAFLYINKKINHIAKIRVNINVVKYKYYLIELFTSPRINREPRQNVGPKLLNEAS